MSATIATPRHGPATGDGAPMEIACAADRAYLPFCAAMIHSAIAHRGDRRLRFHFLHDANLAAAECARLRDWVHDQGCEIELHRIAASRVAGLPPLRGAHRVVWYRIFLDELLPDTGRVLYLDADTFIVDELTALWDTELGTACVAAVANVTEPKLRGQLQRLGLPPGAPMFNSGVMLMNLAQMRADGVRDAVLDFARRATFPLLWADQDALNAVLRDRWLALPPRYNCQNSLHLWTLARQQFGDQAVDDALARPVIFHFEGPEIVKPWHYLCRHPARARYLGSLEATPWGPRALTGDTPLHRILRRLPEPWVHRYWGWRHGRVGQLLRQPARWLRRLVALLPAKLRLRTGQTLRRCGRRLGLNAPAAAIADTLERYARQAGSVRFLQIGSNDAHFGDPLREHIIARGWRGLMVEPVPYIHARLTARWSALPGIQIECAAVTDIDGEREFHYPRGDDDPALPWWYDKIGSFDRDIVLSGEHLAAIPDLAERLQSEPVRCLRFDTLCRLHDIEQLDLLHLDCEGHDWAILQQVDLSRYRPAIVLIEHKHLDAEARAGAREHLSSAGYACLIEGPDLIAVQRAWLSRLFPGELPLCWRRAT